MQHCAYTISGMLLLEDTTGSCIRMYMHQNGWCWSCDCHMTLTWWATKAFSYNKSISGVKTSPALAIISSTSFSCSSWFWIRRWNCKICGNGYRLSIIQVTFGPHWNACPTYVPYHTLTGQEHLLHITPYGPLLTENLSHGCACIFHSLYHVSHPGINKNRSITEQDGQGWQI